MAGMVMSDCSVRPKRRLRCAVVVPVREVQSTTVAPESTVTVPDQVARTDANADVPSKTGNASFTQSLTPDGTEIDEGPASGLAAGPARGTSVAGQSVADAGGREPPATPPKPATAPETAGAAEEALPVGQRAIFLPGAHRLAAGNRTKPAPRSGRWCRNRRAAMRRSNRRSRPKPAFPNSALRWR